MVECSAGQSCARPKHGECDWARKGEDHSDTSIPDTMVRGQFGPRDLGTKPHHKAPQNAISL